MEYEVSDSTIPAKLYQKSVNDLSIPAVTRRGFEEATNPQDLIMPIALLLQDKSPDVLNGEFAPGTIIDSLTKSALPKEFIPIFKYTFWMRKNPLNKTDVNFNRDYEAGQIIYKTNDPQDPRVLEDSKWGENGEQPIATKYLCFFSYFVGHPVPVVLSFYKTKFKMGQQLLSLTSLLGRDMFERKYLIESFLDQKEQTFYNYKIAPIGKVTEEQFKICESLWQQFHRSKIETDVE